MHYLALGDSISIDKYTGVPGRGAASQLARAMKADTFQDLTVDGHTTINVLTTLPSITGTPDLITLTVGGNDLLGFVTDSHALPPTRQACNEAVLSIMQRIHSIVEHLKGIGGLIILNTVYDPTDGSDEHLAELRLSPFARHGLVTFNDSLRALARSSGACLCDLERLFHGHGFWSSNPWLTEVIEPNLAGATAIAKLWVDAAYQPELVREP